MKQIYKFNLDGHQDYFKQIKLNYKNKMNTWAVFWAASVFENDGLCLTPKAPFSRNIGFDLTELIVSMMIHGLLKCSYLTLQ